MICGGGFSFLTADPVLIAVVKRCAQLESEVRELRFQETARFRSLRRDVKQIRKATCGKAQP
jgi:hypothetical protein